MIFLKHKWLMIAGLASLSFGAYLLHSANSSQWFGSPSFSPDGTYLLFSFKKGWSENIYRVKRDGTDLLKLTSLTGKNYHPVYSPDGTKIVFAHADSLKHGKHSDLYIMNTNGSGKKILTNSPDNDYSPIFSKDGRKIYFLRAHSFEHYSPFAARDWHRVDVYSVNIDGSNLKAETDFSYYELSQPNISFDGKKILITTSDLRSSRLFWEFEIEDHSYVESIHPDFDSYLKQEGKKLEKESDYLMNLSDPKFSPDGKTILFIWTTGVTGQEGYFEYELYSMNRETNQIIKLTNFHKLISYPSYSLDGKEVVFVFDPNWPNSGPNELWSMYSDGANPRKMDIQI